MRLTPRSWLRAAAAGGERSRELMGRKAKKTKRIAQKFEEEARAMVAFSQLGRQTAATAGTWRKTREEKWAAKSPEVQAGDQDFSVA